MRIFTAFMHIFIYVFLMQTMSVAQVSLSGVNSTHRLDFNEKLTIETDRNIYIAGERVLFKIYKQNAFDNQPDSLSKVIYTELLNAQNNSISQTKVHIENWTAGGEIQIPATISTGNYLIRAYTRWMKNFSPVLFAYHSISIINPEMDKNRYIFNKDVYETDSIAFFPQGGDLINNLKNRLTIKTINSMGNTIPGKEVYFFTNNDTTGVYRTDKNGDAIIPFTPDKNSTYQLSVEENNTSKIFRLPTIKSDGVAMQITVDEKVNIRFEHEGSLPHSLSLFVFSHGSRIKKVDIENIQQVVQLNRNELPTGVLLFQLMSNNKKTESFRYVNIPPISDCSVHISNLKPVYNKRDNINLNFSINGLEQNEIAHFTIKVVKSCFADTTTTSLSKGIHSIKIQNSLPTNYFLPTTRLPDFLPELEHHIISGSITDSLNQKMNDKMFAFSVLGKSANCTFRTTDENGHFNFLVDEYGDNEIVIQPLAETSEQYYVELFHPFSTDFLPVSIPVFMPDTSLIKQINNGIVNLQISNKFSKPATTSTSVVDTIPDYSKNFYGKPENVILISDYIPLKSVHEIVKEIVPLVYNHKKSGEYSFRMINKHYNTYFDNGPFVLVDGVPVFEAEKVRQIPFNRIERIELVEMNYYSGKNLFQGILHFITKKGNMSGYDFPLNIFRQVYSMYSPVKYHFPDYSDTKQKNSRLPDRRNTLYWHTGTIAGGETKNISFFTADEKSTYTFIISGITTKSVSFSQNYSFSVE